MKKVLNKKMLKRFVPVAIATFFLVITVGFTSCQQSGTGQASSSSKDTQEVKGLQHYDGYTMEQMTVLSRHNIRSPLTGEGSTLGKLTPHQWFNWTAKSSELSLLGGQLETLNGQYFKRFLEKENFIPENWVPEKDETYFYANSYQRTIATAQYFSSGMLPIANVDVEHKYELGKMDLTFLPFMTYMNDKQKDQIMKEIAEQGGEKGLNGITENLSEEIKTLEKALDFKDSEYAKEKNIESLPLDDLEINIEEGDELTCKGTLKTANSAADAFKLQYYEEPDDTKAALGKNLTYKEWEQIGKIADVYETALFGSYTASINAAHPMLIELQKDMNNQKRKFTFLCGHDSTIMSVVTALGVSKYELPNAISKLTPIGSKLVITKYKNNAGEEYCTLNMVYQTVNQLRTRTALDVDTPPMAYQLKLDGLQANSEGMYKLSDVQQRFSERIAEYDKYK